MILGDYLGLEETAPDPPDPPEISDLPDPHYNSTIISKDEDVDKEP